MRVLVCGGRDYRNRKHLFAVLDGLHLEGIDCIIHGAAVGADYLADLWAGFTAVPVMRFPADWARWGGAAGAIRNRRMILEGAPDLVAAFPGGTGTADMMRQARDAGIEVREA